MKIEEYFEHLKSFQWFQNVGKELPEKFISQKVHRLNSWEETTEWAQHEITTWCSVESGNLLSTSVRLNAPERFSQWNQEATTNFPYVEELLTDYIKPNLPETLQHLLSDHIQSQLVGAFMEVAFEDCSKVNLRKEHFKVYEAGFFPCGWFVESPESFPEESTVVIF